MKIDISGYQNIIVLTGAGISKASGIQTFRGENGVLAEADSIDSSSLSTLRTVPQKVLGFYSRLKASMADAKPNPAHLTLAKLEQGCRTNFHLFTQNIDGLHQQAGSQNILELHGSLHRAKCQNETCPWKGTDFTGTCPVCGNGLRPDIVLFGEFLDPEIDYKTKRLLRDCDLFIAIGTSGVVFPAAGYVRSAEYAGARTIYINPEKTDNPYFKEQYLGKAEELVPKLFGE